MPYQQPVPLDAKDGSFKGKAPQACKTPDLACKLFPYRLRRRSSTNYQDALLINKFDAVQITKAASKVAEENAKSPFKQDYSITHDSHHILSPTLSPDDENENDLSRWSSEGSKRSRQRASVDLTKETDDNDLNVDYNYARNAEKYEPEATEEENRFQKPRFNRESSVYHSNQTGSTSDLNLITDPDKEIKQQSFQYDEFKRKMQYD